MFKVEPVRDPELHRAVCAHLGCYYVDGTYAFLAGEMNEEMTAITDVFGICQFVLDPAEAVIKSIAWSVDHENDEAITIMVRTVMSFCHRAEIPLIAIDEGAAPEDYIKSIGFRKKDGAWRVDLKRFYVSPCHYDPEKQ